jgi:aldose 1-epimerase
MKAIRYAILMTMILGTASCKNKKPGQDAGSPGEKSAENEWFLDPAGFQENMDGRATNLYRLVNPAGMEVYVTNFGAVIPAILVPDRNGNMGDIVLGFNQVEKYAEPGDPYFGAVVGRYGNRIDGGKFELNGTVYELPVNEVGNNNQLHGGEKGFSEKVWETGQVTDNSIELKLVSPDGEMGYPGNLELTVTYTLREDNSLNIDYRATTDAPTVLNVTQHSYFNLLGEGNGDILNHELMINADHYTPVTERLIPTGEIAAVAGTPMDFTKPVKIGERINEDFEQLNYGRGYDHNWVLNRDEERLILAARVSCPETGRVLEVLTTEPGVQFYCGNFLDGSLQGKSGAAYEHRYGFCFETQHFPDSPNQPGFPSTVLNPGEEYHSTTVFRFSVEGAE